MARVRTVALFLSIVALTALTHGRLRDGAWPSLGAPELLTVSVRTFGPGAVSCLDRLPRGSTGACWIEASPGARLVGLVDNGVDRTAQVSGDEYALVGVLEPHYLVVSFERDQSAAAVGPSGASLAKR